MKQLFEHFSWKPSDTLLSLGCGSAWWEVNLLLHRPCREIILVDPNTQILSMEAVQESIDYFEKKQSLSFSIQVQIFHKPIAQLPIAPQSIDGIFVFNAWHELTPLEEILPALKRIVKPGGWILLEEELSLNHRRIHEGCAKDLYFQEEIDLQMARIQFQISQKLVKEKQTFYLKYVNR
ncbi:methyltransferase domain-containing protein [Cytophagaceae bacterium 50C-KIRBA]|uniref:Methyltransferase domain-containing protein n=1 Tax=Aquirufa beregesia TaxID=2516556 RepID=A0ABX0F0A9_9BACT|nr:class I SAM-dependent methyltransferase [Aquirufa beregesia]NGZ45202.1 methyltransferase domain-containing protein [Aquirufa beregesia]